MRLPRLVYESLPVAYVLGGLAVTLTHPDPMPYFSGLLLATGGLIILFKRQRYRLRLQRRHGRAHRRTLAGDSPGW